MRVDNLYGAILAIAESAEAPLFTSYRDDLYRHDADTLRNDAQPGDQYLWALKTCGTWLVLLNGPDHFAKEVIHACEHRSRYFLMEVAADGVAGTIIELASRDEALRTVARVVPQPSRKPRRAYLRDVVRGISQELVDTVLLSDLAPITSLQGENALLRIEGGMVTMLISRNDSRRDLLLRTVPEVQGTFSLEITSEFGHAELRPIEARVFNRSARRQAKHAA